jgi:hypothetical protein
MTAKHLFEEMKSVIDFSCEDQYYTDWDAVAGELGFRLEKEERNSFSVLIHKRYKRETGDGGIIQIGYQCVLHSKPASTEPHFNLFWIEWIQEGKIKERYENHYYD